MARTIPLSNGMVATVSDEDYPELAQYHWYGNLSDGRWYAMTHAIRTPSGSPSVMHRLIPCAGEGPEVIHLDDDSLNNRRENLVRATRAEVVRAQRLSHRNTSGFRGVSRTSNRKSWRASICVHGRRIHLGTFPSDTVAAHAYDRAAREHFGRFARLNFPREGELRCTT